MDSLVSDFLNTVQALEALAKKHVDKSANHASEAQQLLALSEQAASEADRAAKIALNIKNIVNPK